MTSYLCHFGFWWSLWLKASTVQKSTLNLEMGVAVSNLVPTGYMAPSSTPSPFINRGGYWITKLKYYFSCIFFSSDYYTVKAQTLTQLLGPNYLMNRTIRYLFGPGGTMKKLLRHEGCHKPWKSGHLLSDASWALSSRGSWIPTQLQ